ncbi:MAG: M48 family metalloprotease [Deltaproteobacteria bacterium]|nr:M48 family metalloprotease [Deltaproteobacteria bacterium]
MGEEFLVQIRKHFEFADDDFANKFFNDLGHYLIRPMDPKYFPFNFYIIKSNDLNAFAAPGGHVFFFSGLIENMDSIDELASVICHEIGHVSARHIAQRIEQNKKITIATLAGVLAGILIGGPAAGAIITGSQAAGIQAQLNYSRDDERQADQLGFKYTKLSGFDPHGMISTLQKLESGRWGPHRIPAYLLTHPTGPERMANLDSLLSDYVPGPPKREVARFRALFPIFKTILRAKCLDPDYAERLFNLELKKNPGASLPHFGLGIVHMKKSEISEAIRHLEKALEGYPRAIPIMTSLGEAYQLSGQDKEAIRVLKKALDLDYGNMPTLYLLGISYENLDQYENAIHIFERLASDTPVKNEVYYHLGISYGRQNRLMLAHYNFGLYFKKIGQIKNAKFHFRKAEDLSRNNPALQKKIRQAMEEKS